MEKKTDRDQTKKGKNKNQKTGRITGGNLFLKPPLLRRCTFWDGVLCKQWDRAWAPVTNKAATNTLSSE